MLQKHEQMRSAQLGKINRTEMRIQFVSDKKRFRMISIGQFLKQETFNEQKAIKIECWNY